MRKLFLVTTAVVILTAAGFAVACDDESSEEEARAALCADLEQLEVAVDTFLELNAQSTIGEVEAARDNLTDAADAVESSAKDVPEADTTELKETSHTVDETIEEMQDDNTVQEVLDAVSITVEDLAAAHQQLFADLGCGGSTPTVEAQPTEPTIDSRTDEPTAGETVPVETAAPTESAEATETIDPTEASEAAPTSEGG